MTIILFFALGLVDLDYDSKLDSIKHIFPMFRGVGLLILYLWGMAWNSYGFQRYRINFPLIL